MHDVYEDFVLRIVKLKEGSDEDRYVIMIDNAPMGLSDIATLFPHDQVKNLKQEITDTFETAIKNYSSDGYVEYFPTLEEMERIGKDLYKILMSPEKIKESYNMTQAVASVPHHNLRIRLRIDKSLVNLPWEFLLGRQLTTGGIGFLVQDAKISIARYLPAWYNRAREPVELPLKLLIITANPDFGNYTSIDCEMEIKKLKSALQPLLTGSFNNKPLLQMDIIKGARTLGKLTGMLRDRGPYHIIHYIGHGDYDPDPKSDRTFLLLEGSRRVPAKVEGGSLIAALDDGLPWLRLFMLNTCKGAIAPTSEAYNGIALSLVRAGIPAVVAMQFEITDFAAQELASYFYTTLFRTGSVDEALSSARRELSISYPETIEWATPVLYLGITNGQLFSFSPALEDEIQKIIKTHKECEEKYKEALKIMDKNQLDEARDLFLHIQKKRPGFLDVEKNISKIEEQLCIQDFFQQINENININAFRKAWELWIKLNIMSPKYPGLEELKKIIQEGLKRFDDLYKDGLFYMSRGEIQRALDCFKKLKGIDPLYPGLDEQLEKVDVVINNNQSYWYEVIRLRAEAETLERVNKWDESTEKWKELESKASIFYKDNTPDKNVKKMCGDAKEVVKLCALYKQMVDYFNSGEWEKVVNLCIKLLGENQEFRDVEDFLRKARDKQQESDNQEQEKKKNLPLLYKQLIKAEKTREWDKVITLGMEIEEIVPGYEKTKEIIENAHKRKAQKTKIDIKKITKGKVVKNLLNDIENAYESREWNMIIDLCNEILSRDPENKDAKHYLKEAKDHKKKMDSIRIHKKDKK